MKNIKYHFRDNYKLVSFLYSKLLLIRNNHKYLFKKIGYFKNIHNNSSCYIIGTGPSLKDFNLRELEDEYVIGTNFFFLHKDFKILKKPYICFAPNHHPLNFEIWNDLFSKTKNLNIRQLFIGDTNYKFSISNYINSNNLYHNDNLCLLNYFASPILNNKNIKFENLHDLSIGPLISPVTTLVTALQLAYFMGFKKIFLLGIDHNVFETHKNNFSSNSHFYENDQSHETSDIDQTKTRIFKWLYDAWTQYEILNKFYVSKNIEVLNLNKSSFLDVFKKN